MKLNELVKELRFLLPKAKRGALDDDEKWVFDELSAELAKMLVAGQGLTLAPGQTYRQALRVAYLLKIDLTGDALRESSVTVNLSSGGFAAMLPAVSGTGQCVRFVMHTLPHSVDGRARLVSLARRGSAYVASFSIEEMNNRSRELLELVILEAVLGQVRV